jgi:GMP synthase-like glutamine amidotransferase
VGPCAYGLQFHPEVDFPIVADWCLRASAGPDVLEDFRRQEEPCRQTAERLLANFLRLADDLPAAG